jgi:hypothetical protein
LGERFAQVFADGAQAALVNDLRDAIADEVGEQNRDDLALPAGLGRHARSVRRFRRG